MSEAVLVLCFIGVGVLVFAAVGHGIWLVFVAIFRLVFGASVSRCPKCGAAFHGDSSRCRSCGWTRAPSVAADPGSELRAAARTLERFRLSGALDPATCDLVRKAIETEELRLAGRIPRQAAAPPILLTTPGESSAPVTATPTVGVPPQPAPGEVAAPIHEPAPIELPGVGFTPHPVSTRSDRTSLADRVAKLEVLGKPAPPPEAPPPSPPRKPLTQVLAAFMEERNIRWGELVGGVLIIGCSIALVFSLWSQIERSGLQFFLFTAVTSAIFGVGLYTEHRWKLPMTSRGVLITATLLVPLNFLAIAAFSRDMSAFDPRVLSAELVALGAFAWLCYCAGGVIVPDWSWILVTGVLGPSVAQFLVRGFGGAEAGTATLLTLGSIPLLAYWGATVWMLTRTSRWKELGEREANRMFVLLGSVTFSALLAFGLVVHSTGHPALALRATAPLVSLGGVPALASGLVLWRRLARADLGAIRTAGTSIAVAGALVLLAGIACAWPDPAEMLPVAIVDFIALSAVALFLDLPAAHALAAPCLALAYLIVLCHLLPANHVHHVEWKSTSPQMFHALVSGTSGTGLTLMVAVSAAVSKLLRCLKREADSKYYLFVTAAIAAASLALVTWFGFGRAGDPQGATWVFAIYAVAVFVGAWRTRLVAVTWAGSGLALVTLVQAAVYRYADRPDASHWQLAMLMHATGVVLASMVAAGWRGAHDRSWFAAPLTFSGLISSLAAVPFWVVAAWSESSWQLASYTLWLAAVWFVLAILLPHVGLFSAAQLMLTLGLIFVVGACLQTQDWYQLLPNPRWDPWTLQFKGAALVLLSLAWIAIRGVASKCQAIEPGGAASTGPVDALVTLPRELAGWIRRIEPLLNPRWPLPDRVVTLAVLVGFVLLTLISVSPGVARELASRASSQTVLSDSDKILLEHASGVGAWIVLVLLSSAFLAGSRERFSHWQLHGLVISAAMASPLLAGRWQDEVSVASALRWSAGFLLATASVPIWLRSRVAERARVWGWTGTEHRPGQLALELSSLLFALTIVPVLGLTLYPAVVTLTGGSIAGVASSSFFGQIGDAANYVVPMTVVSLVLVGYAVRERSDVHAFSAGLVLQLTVTLGYLLMVVTSPGGQIGQIEWVRLVQLNAVAAAGFALLWINLRGWLLRTLMRSEPGPPNSLLRVQVVIGLALNMLLLLPADVFLFLDPGIPPDLVTECGTVLGWLALGLAVGAVVALNRTTTWKWSAGVVGSCLLVGASLLAFSLSRLGYSWGGFHALLSGRAVTGWLMLALGWAARNFRVVTPGPIPIAGSEVLPSVRESGKGQLLVRLGLGLMREVVIIRWSMALAALTVILALRAAVDGTEPGRPWWSSGSLVVTSVLMAALGRYGLRRGFLYGAGVLFNLAVSIWWLVEFGQAGPALVIEFVEVNVVAMALPSIAWLAMEMQIFRREMEEPAWRGPVPFHHIAAVGSVIALFVCVLLGLFTDVIERSVHATEWIGWSALAAAGALMCSCLWDVRARYAVAGLYALGLIAAGMVVDRFDLSPHWLGWTGVVVLAAYSVATSYLWSQRARLQAAATALHIQSPIDAPLAGQVWLLVANQILATAVVVLAYYVVLTFEEYGLRLVAGKAAVAQALAVGLLAQGTRRTQLQRVSLVLVAIGAVAWGWAWLDPHTSGNLLNRSVTVLTTLAILTAVYGLGLGKFFPRETEWTRAAKDLVPGFVGVCAGALGFILVTEIVQYDVVLGSPMSWLAKLAIIVALTGLATSALVCAIVPGRDPLALPERGRMWYVYVAEVFGGLLFMHVRLTMPWLFTGLFLRYWTLIVMALAFLGVGLSEVFRRQGRLVLAEPLERTGAFLPLLPVMSLWFLHSEVNYSVLLILVGSLYGVLSVARKSFGWGVLAALAVNGSLWYHLHNLGGYGLLQHPQFWLVPAAISVLVAAYLNREQLRPEQFVAIRYVATMIIYISSTADIFVNGVRESPWLPMLLAGLSLVGIFSGILLRVRAFLFLGSSFLVLALITMILSAQVNLLWTWLWWVAGITLGVMIIAMFAVFEKKRGEVLRLVDELRQWEP